MLALLEELRHKVAVGFVGGSDLVKQQEQLGSIGVNGMQFSIELISVIDLFDYCFSENGLTAYKQGTKLASQVSISKSLIRLSSII
jgi:phosphomannomutase